MKNRFSLHFLVALLLGTCLACGKSSMSPSFDAVGDFITSITASDGSAAARESGSPPTPNGGPTLTATSSGSVAAGGTDTVALRASAPIQTVYVSVNSSDGFYQVQLQASTTNITLSNQQASQLPSGSYTASYRASAPGTGGLVGSPTTVTNTVTSTGGGGGGGGSTVNVTGTWLSAGTPVLILTQSGSTVTGSEIIPSTPGVTYTTNTLTGTISGNSFNATLVFAFAISSATGTCTITTTLTGTVSSDGRTISGTGTNGNLSCTGQLATVPGLVGPVTPGPFTLTKQ